MTQCCLPECILEEQKYGRNVVTLLMPFECWTAHLEEFVLPGRC